MEKGIFNHTNGEIQNSVWLSGSLKMVYLNQVLLILMLREIMN
jgi:hypothetical protein